MLHFAFSGYHCNGEEIMKRLTLIVLYQAVLLLAPCSAAAEKVRISITGSSTLAPLAVEISKRFETLYKDARIDVQTGGSSRGIADARRGLADIGMSSRALYEEEKTGLKTYTVAMDGVTFVTHASNPVTNLSKEQARAIYTGKIKNWKSLGGLDAPITVIERAKGRSEHDLVSKYLGISARDIKADVVAGENQQCVKLVTGNRNALAYLSVGTAEYEAENGTPLKLLALDGVRAASDTVKDGSFPIVRPLIFVTSDKQNVPANQFLDFALSPKVQDLVKGQAFVPVR